MMPAVCTSGSHGAGAGVRVHCQHDAAAQDDDGAGLCESVCLLRRRGLRRRHRPEPLRRWWPDHALSSDSDSKA
eukprot:1838666-Rhodomonas_salina.2